MNSIQESDKKIPSFNTISAILLVAGTCTGAGMLAIPIVTGFSGFIPSLLINFICWLFMLTTGLLFLEATLWMKEGSNVLSMALRFFGPLGKWIGGLFFLFLYYCLEVSYIAGGTPIFNEQIQLLGIKTENNHAYFLFALFFGFIVYLGTKAIDRLNWILMTALILSYVLLIAIGSRSVNFSLLKEQNWPLFFLAAPTLFSAYGYHNIIPTLSTLMNQHKKSLRTAIITGTTIPFIIYSLWQWMTIGILSKEQFAIAASEGIPVTELLNDITGHPWISFLSNYFGFFALITSFLGVSLSMVDFLADGFSIKAEKFNRLFLCLLVFIPPTIFAANHPGIFLEALGIAGGFGEAVLNGLFPIGMVWVGRYHLQLERDDQVRGGKPLLILLTLFTFFIIFLEAVHLMGLNIFL